MITPDSKAGYYTIPQIVSVYETVFGKNGFNMLKYPADCLDIRDELRE
jgi:hypothetical protein